jgi:hypothetical protein
MSVRSAVFGHFICNLLTPSVIPAVLSNRRSNTNTFETNEIASVDSQSFNDRSNFRTKLLAMVALVGIGNTAVALTDAYREGYSSFDGYLFIGIATLIPMIIGIAGMLVSIVRHFTTYLIWSAGAMVAMLPGLLVWSAYAALPTPRNHMGAGQMHIFFLPVIHIGYCLLVYLGTGLLALVVSETPES